ncbi:alpha/beta fold hydrolase [Streptomyces edwardsiae]|uniref:Alpha/beta fold hydrolase n=1 Tax=Streptomyces edwardsiae TaxID=3075527 RepID=A0ABU2PVX8_9ACTN|nr:alpha/beta fold hydrolase [Streptomyces sp. DSM 41636]MDT0395956.1 alpha/beta fold hydrolase [Streptomyces sp. DSM 41636]
MDLRLPALRRLRPRRTVAAAAAVVVLAGAGTWTAVASDEAPAVRRADRVMAMEGGVRIDTSYFTSGGDGRRPAVLLGHGFGGSKDDVREQAEELARDGYAVLTWSARGFGKSTGQIGLNDPKGEVADVSRLIDWLAGRPEVRLDQDGDPRVGMAGGSYGGAIALLGAGYDDRVDAIAPAITYFDLADALFPNGVFKKLWAGVFVNSGGGCEKFEATLCAMYERVAESGVPDDEARELLEARSPSAVAGRIDVPTLLLQGQTDSLFPLGQADAAAKAIRANGAPVDVDWIAGGHDGGDPEADRVRQRVRSWFDRYLKGDEGADTGPAFRVTRTGGVDSTDGRAVLTGASADTYPGLTNGGRAVPLTGREKQSFANPAGAGPPAISSLPGLGGTGGLAQLSSLGVGVSLDFPGQYARFESAPVADDLRITGSPAVTVHVESTGEDAVLFGKVYDVGPDGRQQVLPSQLVTPLRVEGAKAGKDVTITLPAVDHEVRKGHRLRLVLASTDLGYASPAAPATYTVSLKSDLTVPTAPRVTTAAAPLPAWVVWLPVAGALIALALLLTGRRRTTAPAPDPGLADVPLQITGLSKRYTRSSDRYAVRDLSFRVEKGQVLGLLGPNGAGKTTTLRMLMGLIRPDGGEIRVFGHAIRPGAPVLSRVGAFVEGAGFLPHLSGRENLELYWRATGRPAEDAHLEEALAIAGLGDALARAVRTYSQGMRQRLAIAQAMLGLPDLLILDEPTNGLDPPQIREMREVMIRYAAAGRTVIVSSHLLSEVEQSCTHLVVMDRGQLVQAGPVHEIVGSGDTLLVGTVTPVDEPVAEKIAALPGIASAVRTDEGLLIRLDADGTAPRLVAELVRLEVPVASVGPHRRLEDAFLTLIGGSA